MEGLAIHPALSTKVPRGYGKCEYERFDNISSAHRVGHGSIGNIIVDCRFLFTKAQWGLIGNNMNPGGIMYFDLDFDQPADTRLRSATVLVTLKEYEGTKRRSQHVSALIGSGNQSPCPVKFTQHYGPRYFHGPERSMRTHREKHLVPNVNIAGYGVGGVGLTTEQDSNRVSRWKFAGHIGISKGNIWYDTLKWTLEENELESQSIHSNILHTAFAIEHNANEFYMTVEVSGKLVGLSDRFKNRMKRFGGGEGKRRETVTTKFQWTNGYSCLKRLDKLAEGLEYSMKHANLHEVPLEVPDTLPAQFRPMTEPKVPVPESIYNSDDRSLNSPWPDLSHIPIVPKVVEEEPTLDELAKAAGFALIARGPQDDTGVSELPASTLVGSEREDSLKDNSGTEPMQMAGETEQKTRGDDKKSDTETLIWLTQMPIIAVVLKLVAVLVMGFRAKQIGDGPTTDADSEDEEAGLATSQLGTFSSAIGGVDSPDTDPDSIITNGNSHVRRRKRSMGLGVSNKPALM